MAQKGDGIISHVRNVVGAIISEKWEDERVLIIED